MSRLGLSIKVRYYKIFNNQTWDIPKGWHVYEEYLGGNPHHRKVSASKEYDPRKASTYKGQAIKRIPPESVGKVKKVVEVTHGCD